MIEEAKKKLAEINQQAFGISFCKITLTSYYFFVDSSLMPLT